VLPLCTQCFLKQDISNWLLFEHQNMQLQKVLFLGLLFLSFRELIFLVASAAFLVAEAIFQVLTT
jgi:hypothetical protein